MAHLLLERLFKEGFIDSEEYSERVNNVYGEDLDVEMGWAERMDEFEHCWSEFDYDCRLARLDVENWIEKSMKEADEKLPASMLQRRRTEKLTNIVELGCTIQNIRKCRDAEEILNRIKEGFKSMKFSENEIIEVVNSSKENETYLGALLSAVMYFKCIARKWDVSIEYCTTAVNNIDRGSDNCIKPLFKYLRGSCHMNMENNMEAHKDFADVVHQDGFYRAYLSKAVLYERSNDFNRALILLDTAVEENQVTVLYRYRAGLLKNRFQEFGKALEDYDRAIKLSPYDYSAYNNRGVLRRLLAKNEEAVNDFSKAILLKPDCIFSYINRAGLYETMPGKRELASHDYNTVLQLDPNEEDAIEGLARMKNQLIKSLDIKALPVVQIVSSIRYATTLDEALGIYSQFEKAIEMKKQQLTNVLGEIQQMKPKEKDMEEFLLIRIVFLRILAKDCRQAVTEINVYLRKESNSTIFSSLLLMLRGVCLTDLGQVELAMHDFEMVEEKEPQSAKLFLQRAFIHYSKTKEYQLAMEDIECSLLCDPTCSDSFNLRGLLFEKQGDILKAQENYKKALEQDSSNTSARDNLTRVTSK